MTKITNEIKDLFQRVKIELGAPIRTIQLTDEQLCVLLENCISDYAEKVQNWLVENQWMTLYGKNISSTDMAYAMSVRTFDLAQDYSYYFSKEVGLQQRGPWELKKDYIEIESGKQVYVIPAGREINSVMWMTPPVTQAALFANYAGIDVGFGGGYAQMAGACQCCRHKKHGFDPWVRKIPWRRARQPTPVFLPGESHGQRSLVGLWGHKDSDTTEAA